MESIAIDSGQQSRSLTGNDRVRPETRVVAALVVGVLILAIWALYLYPGQTDNYFAWTIKPNMTPLAMGAGYAMGAYFFLRVLTSRRWHHTALGFFPITAFTIVMLLATFMHWDRFHQGTLFFALWVIIYVITPFLVPLIWLRNRAADPGVPDPDDWVVAPAVRRIAAVAGVVVTLAAIIFFILPDLAIHIWPWQLTPLTARVLAGWLMLPGIGGLVLSREARWSGGWRLMVESITVGGILFFIGVARAWGDWQFANPLNGAILAAIVLAFAILLLLYFQVERARRSQARNRAV